MKVFNGVEMEQSVYYRYEKDTTITYLVVYVDDLLVFNTGGGKPKIADELLKLGIKIKDLGHATRFLGLKVKQSKDGIHLSMPDFIASKLTQFHVTAAPVRVPYPTIPSFTGPITLLNSKLHADYRSIVGSLVWLNSTCRPDISHAVIRVASQVAAPTTEDLYYALNILRYLKGTIYDGCFMNSPPLHHHPLHYMLLVMLPMLI